ncbi:hypothetical protein HK405_000388, partial [Cladochytrium tenue]
QRGAPLGGERRRCAGATAACSIRVGVCGAAERGVPASGGPNPCGDGLASGGGRAGRRRGRRRPDRLGRHGVPGDVRRGVAGERPPGRRVWAQVSVCGGGGRVCGRLGGVRRGDVDDWDGRWSRGRGAGYVSRLALCARGDGRGGESGRAGVGRRRCDGHGAYHHQRHCVCTGPWQVPGGGRGGLWAGVGGRPTGGRRVLGRRRVALRLLRQPSSRCDHGGPGVGFPAATYAGDGSSWWWPGQRARAAAADRFRGGAGGGSGDCGVHHAAAAGRRGVGVGGAGDTVHVCGSRGPACGVCVAAAAGVCVAGCPGGRVHEPQRGGVPDHIVRQRRAVPGRRVLHRALLRGRVRADCHCGRYRDDPPGGFRIRHQHLIGPAGGSHRALRLFPVPVRSAVDCGPGYAVTSGAGHGRGGAHGGAGAPGCWHRLQHS